MDVKVAKMKACRVATRATSKMKNGMAIRSVNTPSAGIPEQDHESAGHEEDQQVAARMLAKSRTDSEMIPDEVRDDSMMKSGIAAPPVMPPGMNDFR